MTLDNMIGARAMSAISNKYHDEKQEQMADSDAHNVISGFFSMYYSYVDSLGYCTNFNVKSVK